MNIFKHNKYGPASEPHFLGFLGLRSLFFSVFLFQKVNSRLILPWFAAPVDHRDRRVDSNNGGGFGSFHFKATGSVLTSTPR